MVKSGRPLIKQCKILLLQELRNITIKRMGNTISVYDIITTILEDPKIHSVFCEGSFVMYVFNKLCKNHSEHKLVKPGDIDLHIDYHGSWYSYITHFFNWLNPLSYIKIKQYVLNSDDETFEKGDSMYSSCYDDFEDDE